MYRISDHDGKSQTASAVDAAHYPETKPAENNAASSEEISKLAHHMWVKRGCPHGSAELDWQEAEREILHGRTSQAQIKHVNDVGGSVQS